MPSDNSFTKTVNLSFSEILLIPSAVLALLHFCYFQLAPYIWAQSEPIPTPRFTPWVRGFSLERDGVEVYALYGLMFTAIILTTNLTACYPKVTAKTWRYSINTSVLLATCTYFAALGFQPPMNTVADRTLVEICRQTLPILGAALLVQFLFYLTRNSTQTTVAIALIILLPACFIATGPAYWPDYGYIFAPALRILNGTALADIYLQYDLLLSLFAALFMALHLDLDFFQVFGQASFLLFLLGLFLFARKLFFNKNLAALLLIAVILVRIYGNKDPLLTSFQVTPLRLDLWLVLLVAVYFRGPLHWLSGLLLCLLIVLHRNFGIIYFAGYCQLLATLLLLEYIDNRHDHENRLQYFGRLIIDYFRRNKRNLSMIAAAFIGNSIIFSGNSAYRYQKIGVGFMPIAKGSFYWYVAIMVTVTMAMLVKARKYLPEKYLYSGIFTVYLAIGNSLYFFGRSHENNIINISAIFLFLLFIALDIAQTMANQWDFALQSCRRHFALIASGTVIFIIATSYGDRIESTIRLQSQNAGKMQFIYRNEFSQPYLEQKFSDLRKVTSNSPKVYFVSNEDFFYYYYGHYQQVGYYNPFLSWMFMDDMIKFMNELLGKGYFIATDNPALLQEALPALQYRNTATNDDFAVFWQ